MPVSKDVVFVQDPSGLAKAEEECVPQGYFTIGNPNFPQSADQYVLNLKDLVNTKRHSDYRRLSGCCGLDGLDGMNIVCAEEHELGTECSDCWMDYHYIYIPKEKIEQAGE